MDLNWYKTLIKPAFTPPSEVFTPAWILLYLMIFISVLLYIKEDTYHCKTKGCLYFIIQLVLNLIWSPVFFIFHKINIAFVIICLMLIFIILTITEFYKISKVAAYLLVPYMLWVCFATYLNYGFMILNQK